MAWTPIQVLNGKWGRLQLLFGSKDVTYFRNVPVEIEQWENTEPFGDSVLALTFPQVTPYESAGGGTPAVNWMFNGQAVTLRLIRPDGSKKNLWEGIQYSPGDIQSGNSQAVQIQCIGALYQADLGKQKPRFAADAEDIGKVIADALNGYVSRDYGATAAVTTGIKTRQRGSWTPILTGFVQDLLATATTADGSNQWTVKQNGRAGAKIALKDVTTIHATVTTGAQGVTVDMASDTSSFANVIYGEGTAPDGSRWRNTKYPNLRPDDAPLFPGGLFTAGDGQHGFDPFADEMRRSGYHMESGDTYVSADVAEVRDAQHRAGILVDGIVGPQTWAAIFQVGSDGGNLSGAFFMPLAYDSRVEPYLYNARGEKIGNNPAFDPHRLRIERKIDYGENITKQEATVSARADLARFPGAGYQGTVTLKTDPAEMSRFELRAGMNLKLKKYRGADRKLHIAKVSVNWKELTVTLTVDLYFRDLISLASIKSRNAEAANDPARRASSQRRRSRISNDTIVVFDSESGAGIIPRHALFGGLWTVLRIPAGQVGTIAKTRYQTDSGIHTFSVGVFSKAVTSNTCARLVGNPLAVSGAWDINGDELDDAGLIMSWGDADSAAGYSRRQQGDAGAPVTGKLIDDAGWEYYSDHPPWLWVAEYCPSSCYISGRFYPAVDG